MTRQGLDKEQSLMNDCNKMETRAQGPVASESNIQTYEAAIDYARRGWRVIPVNGIEDGVCACKKGQACGSAGKHPLTNNGLKDGMTERERIDTWWESWPNANVAVVTGDESGIWVLDADGEAGVKAVADLEREHGEFPPTPITRTGGGGRHYFFAWPHDVRVPSGTRLGDLAIDSRGAGGYAIVPPSRHRSGRSYEWELSPDDVEPAQAPDWLVRIATEKELPAGSKAGRAEEQSDFSEEGERNGCVHKTQDLATDPGAPEGERHQRALSLIGAHIARREDLAEITEKALAWASRCIPPMPLDEIRRIITDLSEKDRKQVQTAEVWEQPASFYEFNLPPFPTDALPGWLRDFVSAEATATQTPADLSGMLCLSAMAACCAKKIRVRVNEGYSEPTNLFVAVALPPANRKSAVFCDVTAPIRVYERSETERMAPEIAKLRNEAEIAEARLNRSQKDAANADTDVALQLEEEANRLAQEFHQLKVPKPPRFIAADATPEALGSLLSDHHGRMAVMSPEGDVFDLISGRYGHGTPNFGVYLQAHAGDDLRVDRKNRNPEFVRNPALTVGLAVQPDVICGLGAKRELRGRGLLARFLYALPKSLLGYRDPNPPAVPKAISSEYARNVSALLEIKPQLDEAGDIVPFEVHLCPAAEMSRIEFIARLEPMLGEGGELGTIQDWAGKLGGAVLRIAGLLHMAEQVADKSPWNQPMSAETMNRAIRIGNYLIAHAQAAFAQMGVDHLVEDAKHVLGWMRREGFKTFSERDCFEATKSRFRKVDALRPALATLLTHGYIRLSSGAPRKGPGRPRSPVYEVNPHISAHSQNPQNTIAIENLANSANSATKVGICENGNDGGVANLDLQNGSQMDHFANNANITTKFGNCDIGCDAAVDVSMSESNYEEGTI